MKIISNFNNSIAISICEPQSRTISNHSGRLQKINFPPFASPTSKRRKTFNCIIRPIFTKTVASN